MTGKQEGSLNCVGVGNPINSDKRVQDLAMGPYIGQDLAVDQNSGQNLAIGS